MNRMMLMKCAAAAPVYGVIAARALSDKLAGAMAAATAGIMAGTDPANVWQLPDTLGMKGEVVLLGGRSRAPGKFGILRLVDYRSRT
jgi:hypothetical protein